MTTAIVVVMENWYKTLRTMMAVVPVLKKDPDDDNESVNAYGFDGGCVVDYDGDSDDSGALHRGEGGDGCSEDLGNRKSR